MDFIFDPSCALYLPLHQLDGSSFTSKDAYGHLCSVTGAALEPGRGRYFDGTDDNIVIPTATSLNFGTGSFTLWAWIKTSTSSTSVAVGKGTTGANPWYAFGVWDTGKVLVAIEDDAANGLDGAKDGLTINDGVWHCLAVAVNRVNDTMTRYADSEQTGAIADISVVTGNISPTQDLSIGAANEGNILKFNGDIGMVAIYRRVLTQQEILNNYLATRWRYR